MLRTFFLAVAVMLALFALGSCGTENIGAAPDFGNGGSSVSSFDLDVMDETFGFGATAQEIGLAISSETDTHLVLDVTATGAQGLKGLFFNLEYDQTKYRAMVVEPGSAMGERADILKIMGVAGDGRLQYGQALIQQEYQAGFTGTGTIAQISFRKQATPVLREVRVAPTGLRSQVQDLAFDGADTLTWTYQMQGDYDQNGEANAADLVKVAQNFPATSPGGPGVAWPRNEIRSVIDGDSNGEINGADLVPIAQNIFRSTNGGYHIFSSASLADYPAADPNAPNGAGATEIGTVLRTDATNFANINTERLTFSFTIPAPVANDAYWLRPYDDAGAAGIASNFAGGNVNALPVVSLDPLTPANSGNGTAGSPYNFTPTQDYNFIVIDNPVDNNNVSTDPLTTLAVNPAAAGVFTGNILNLDDAFAGDFTVTATYDGNPASNVINGTVGAVVVPPPFIAPDPTDNDWDTVAGTGADETNAYLLSTSVFNADQTLEFTLQATEGDAAGDVIPNADLTWDAFPPFTVQSAVSFECTGVFQIFQFANGYLFAQDALMRNSNELWVATAGLPN